MKPLCLAWRLAALVCTALPLRADNIAESGGFSVDTRDYGGSDPAEGEDFLIDTLDYAGLAIAESPDFTVNTNFVSGSGPWQSPLFSVDTRAPSPDLAAAEGVLFTVDTRPFSNALPLVLSGRVTSVAGANIGNASVVLQLFGSPQQQVVTLNNGTYQTPPLPPRSYTVVVSAAGWQPQLRNLTEGWRGGAQSMDFQLVPNPLWLLQNSNGRQPTAAEAPPLPGPDPVPDARLKVFSGSINQNAPTVVISYGWQPFGGNPAAENGWAARMGALIYAQSPSPKPNVVAWDWHERAFSLTRVPITEAAREGPLLGAALQDALGMGYSRTLHFIGHSLGTIVNSRACDYLHGGGSRYYPKAAVLWNELLTQPHVTLLDEAEVANPFGSTVISRSVLLARLALGSDEAEAELVTEYEALISPFYDWKGPLPEHATWTDNYVSLVGWTHETAVNACLFPPAQDMLLIIPAHSYAHEWYRDSVQDGAATLLGWDRSRESGHPVPPGAPFSNGSLWLQATGIGRDPMSFTLSGDRRPGGCFRERAHMIAVQLRRTGAAVYNGLDHTGRLIMENYQAGIERVGDLGGRAIIRTGEVLATVRTRVGAGIDAGVDRLARWADSLVPDFLDDGNLFRTTPQLCLRSPNGNLRGGDNEAPSAWLTLQIPPDAGLMAFDFTINGDPADDTIACAVAGQNVFNLPASFVAEGETQSTDYMDVSGWAGQTVEIFFGLTGGTSSNCELLVDSLRFVIIPMPPLVMEDHGATVSLHWPTAASGWLLEATESLAVNSWQEVLPNPGALSAANGITRLEEAKSDTRQFYRLRRRPEP